MLDCQTYSPMRKLNIDRLAEWISLVEPAYWHDLDGWNVVHEHVEAVLDYFEVPKEWKAVVRTMAQGAHYYGEDVWYSKYVDPAYRKNWMVDYWDQN